MERIFASILLALVPLAFAQAPRVKVSFSPESEQYAQATREYQAVWDSEGQRIIEAMERISGVQFTGNDIRAIVYEGVSWSGVGDEPMKLRASYPPDVKKATLIHELGHRLIARIPKTNELDEHRVLFLVLYDMWESLYGKGFADKMVEVEKKRKGLYDYESAWQWALSLSQEERATKFKALRELAGKAINLGLVDGSYTVTLEVTNAQNVPNMVGTMTVTGGNISGWRFVVDANIFPGTNIGQGVGACSHAGQTQDQCASESIGPNNTHPRFFIAVAAGMRNWFYVPVAGSGGGRGIPKYIGTWQATAAPDN